MPMSRGRFIALSAKMGDQSDGFTADSKAELLKNGNQNNPVNSERFSNVIKEFAEQETKIDIKEVIKKEYWGKDTSQYQKAPMT